MRFNRMKVTWMVFHFSKFMLVRDHSGAGMASVVEEFVVPKLVENVVDVGAGIARVAQQNAVGAPLIVRGKDAKVQMG